MKTKILNLTIFALIVLLGVGCTSIPNISKMKNTILGAKDSIVTNVKKTFLGTRNSMVSIAQKTPITRNNKDQDFLFAQHQFNRREFSVSEFYLKKTLANRPEDLRALSLLPWSYFFQKRFDKGIIAFKLSSNVNE